MKNEDENSEIDDVNKVERQITEKIMSGLKDNEFKMYLQFIVDRQTKRIVSAEALSRWENKDHGILGPASYIEKMEELGIIPELDFYMFDLACRQLEKWNNSPYKDISISCNFTRITLSEDNFAQRLKDVFEKYNFDISKIAIEITEDAMEKDT